MKLFPKRDPSASAKPPESETEGIPVLPPIVTISLSDEQKTMLETPVDARVHRIIQKINDSKVAEQSRPPARAAADQKTGLPDTL